MIFTTQIRPAFPSKLEGLLRPGHLLSPFPATDPKNAPVTPFIATLPKSLDFNSFACHTSEPPRGSRHILLTRNLKQRFHLPSVEVGASPEHLRSHFCPGQTLSFAVPPSKLPLSFHALMNCKFSNSFVLIFMQIDGGVASSPTAILLLNSSLCSTDAALSPLSTFSFKLSTLNFRSFVGRVFNSLLPYLLTSSFSLAWGSLS